MINEQTMILDVQGLPDKRHIPITRVGIREVRIPVVIETMEGREVATVAQAEMMVALPETEKGTHMSRFIKLLHSKSKISLKTMKALHAEMLDLLHAEEGTVALDFPFFVEKTAPISGMKSPLDYDVSFIVDGSKKDSEVNVEVTVPVTSLCPCSKEISKYGAHNQRSHIVINALYDVDQPFSIEELIQIAEKEGASCEIWSLLKRPDEKYVTEHAYENPKFTEDIVRDVAMALNADSRIQAYRVSSENFESIHNHSAYALIEHDKRN